MIYRAWVALYVSIGVAKSMKLKLVNRKRSIRRYKTFMKRFVISFRFIGKIRRRLFKYRTKKALKVFFIQKIASLVKYCKRWQLKNYTKKRSTLIHHFNIILIQNSFTYIIKLLNSKVLSNQIIFIQRAMKLAIPIRLSLYDKILDQWNTAENLFFQDIIYFELQKEPNKPNGEQKKVKVSLVPSRIKLEMIREKIREIVKFYSLRMRNYKASQSMLMNPLMRLSWYNQNTLNLHTEKPLPLDLLSEFKLEVLHDLITKAMKQRPSAR